MNREEFIYLYDGSFTNLLNLCILLIKKRIIPLNIKSEEYQPNLLEEVIKLDCTETINVEEFVRLFSKRIFKTIYYLFISNDINKELIIYYFLIHSLKYKDKIYYMRNLKSVAKALKIEKYVGRENHKFKGFLRFKELENNVLYAEINPENNILFILSKHFETRLANEYFIIKDVGRKILSVYDKKNIYIVSEDEFLPITNLSTNEKFIQDLWKSFYKTIGIKERKNNRCRMNFMPKKYWKYIIEVSDEK